MTEGSFQKGREYLQSALLLAVVALTLAIYYPGLFGGFILDDTPQIKNNPAIAVQTLDWGSLKRAFGASPASFPHDRPLSMLSFGLNYYVSGLNPFGYKLTNLIIHLVTGISLFFLVSRLLVLYALINETGLTRERIRWLALATAAAWAVSPVNLTPVVYVVQRMTSLSALFSILALLCYVYGRQRMQEGKSGIYWMLAGVALFTPLGFMSKENAVLVPAMMLIMEFTLFGFNAADPADRKKLVVFFSAALVIPFAILTGYFIGYADELLSGYAGRNFNMPERVLTEARALWFYLYLILFPEPQAFGLFHDDFEISTGLLQPVETSFAVVGVLFLLSIALFMRRRHPLFAFGTLFFLVGHSVESTVLPLELIFEHRNYLPSLGPLLVVFYYLLCAHPMRRRTKVAAVLGLTYILVLGASAAVRVYHWASPDELVFYQLENHPNSPRANYLVASKLAAQAAASPEPAGMLSLARDYMGRVTELNDNDCIGLFGHLIIDLYTTGRVDGALVDEIERRLQRVPFNPQNVSVGQFGILVKRQIASGERSPSPQTMARLFNAALINETLGRQARAALYSIMREYHHKVLGDLDAALPYGYLAVKGAPSTLLFKEKLIHLLLQMGRSEEALGVLQGMGKQERLQISGPGIEELRAALPAR